MSQNQATELNLSFRAVMRDAYAALFNRGFILDRMALHDHDTGSNVVGRIELVEELALGLRLEVRYFTMTKEEHHYADWLKQAFTPELIYFFFYGVSNAA